MVEELKLAIKIDDASIEQSLLKQFANAQKMADKVVLDFRNVNFDDKQIEAKFKEMQKKAGQNPIDLTINGNTFDMLGQIDKRLTEIFSIGKGKSFVDSSSTVDNIERIIDSVQKLSNILDKSFNVKNKIEAFNQLKEAYKNYNEIDLIDGFDKAGVEAAYSFWKSYEEAINKNVAESRLEVFGDIKQNKRTLSDGIIDNYKQILFDYKSIESEITKNNNGIFPSLDDYTIKDINNYVYALYRIREAEKDIQEINKIPINQRDEYNLEDLSNAKGVKEYYQEQANTWHEWILSSIQNQSKLQNGLKETREEIKKTDDILNTTSSSNNDFQIEDLKSDIAEVKTELGEVKNRISSIESNGFENVREDVEKTKESVKELNSELTEMKSNLSSTPQESNISSENTTPSAPPKKDRYAKRRKISEEDFLNYSPNRVNEKLSNSGYTILGETVNTELVDGLVKVSAKIKDADGAWKSFSAKVDADGNIFEQRFKTVTNGVDKLETVLQNFGRKTAPALTYQETLDKAQKIKNSLNLGDEYSIKVDSSEFVTIIKKLTDIENAGSSVTQTFKSAQDAIDNFGKATSNSAEKTSVALKSVKSNVKEVVDETEKLANAQKEQNANVNFNKYDKRLGSYNGKIDKYKTTIDRFNDGGWTSSAYLDNVQAVKNAVKEYKTLLNELKGKDASLVTSENIAQLDKYEKKIKDTIATVTNMSASEKGYNFVSAQKELDKIHKLLNENSKMSSEAKNKIKAYYAEIESGNPSMSLDRIHAEIMKIYNAEVEAGRAGKSFFDTLKNSGFHQIAAQMAGMFGFYDVINLGKQAISTIKELDYALVDLKKTTAMNSSELEQFYYNSNDVAKQMGVTTKEIIDQASSWSRLGYNTKEAATEMAKLSSQFSLISPGMDTTTSQEGLVSIMKAWNIGYQDVKSEIMDNINALGNSMAEDNQDIVEGMERSAAALAAVGTSYEDAFAMFSGIQEVLQNAEVSGRALRSISMRIRGYDESTEELSNDLKNVTGELTDLTKTAEHSQGVSIFKDDSTTEFKSLVDYFGEIYDIWDEMSQKQQNDFLQKAFGKTQAQAGAALIQNYSAVTKSLEVMDNASGSSDREMETVKQSITYKLNELKETWVGTIQELIDRGDIGKLVDGLTKLSEGLGFVIDKLGILGSIGLGAGIFSGIKNVGRDKMYSLSF